MHVRMSRRSLMGVLLAVIGGSLSAPTVLAATRTTSLDTSYWKKVDGPYCAADGLLYETWCYVECAGGNCQQLWCEESQVGSC